MQLKSIFDVHCQTFSTGCGGPLRGLDRLTFIHYINLFKEKSLYDKGKHSYSKIEKKNLFFIKWLKYISFLGRSGV